MSVTLLALYRRPEEGDEAVATFRRRYREEHLPLIRQVPGLRSLEVETLTRQLVGDVDLILVTRMGFDDRASLDAALASEEMRVAGRNLRDVAPGIVELYVAEPEAAMTSAAPAPISPDPAGSDRGAG